MALPYYMAMGMTPHEFWYEDVNLVVAYREAQKLKNERENQMMWLQGLYFYQGMGALLGNALGKGKKTKYLEKPLDLEKKETTQKEAQDYVTKQLKAWQKYWINGNNKHT